MGAVNLHLLLRTIAHFAGAIALLTVWAPVDGLCWGSKTYRSVDGSIVHHPTHGTAATVPSPRGVVTAAAHSRIMRAGPARIMAAW